MANSKRRVLAIAPLLLASALAHADVNSDLNHFFGKLGFESNTTMPHAWQGQAAGYASGGSIYMRTAVKQVQLVSIQVPSLNAGCGGIDAYLGAFSHINGDQLQRFVKQIMGNAAGYFFDLALQTTVPEMKQAKDFLQKLASDVNSMNMSSCQAAQGIVGGLWPKTAVSQQKICQDIAGEQNLFSDWAASRQGCTLGGQYGSVTDKASDKMKDQVLKNKNLMWESLSKNTMFNSNRELKEFAMSLTGTLIFDATGNIKPLVALTTNEDIIKSMMNGGTANIYACDTTTLCLAPTIKPVTISEANSMNGQVKKLLISIQNKAISDTPLTEQEKGFISSTSVPVLKYLVDPQSLGVANTLLYQLSDYIGYDILMQYLQELIQQARIMLGSSNYPEPAIEQLHNSLNQASQNIAVLQSRVQINQSALMVVDRQMSYMRQQLSSRLLERYQSNYKFGGAGS
ncbi:TPA: conjugal transfer protein TraH [Aeromonas dhakensis]|jgi:conjugative transfer pilus assembly protein TraH|uniref:conjugal transfer pilus assembly protein TraH n=1 Tax=Aeromonas jandaei TaxID=650 RepID=UPI001A351C46|nr:conjugal transfer pilus assembly protein TraH [Aeromonas jandaei]HAT3423576.1 conjugal transfer protein TraH [Aeromonas hydrophila]HDX8462587.1 conjugal transfer protein TraH [Aeromonas dhakensis]MBW3808221.1 conjugal transfer protein TraH [Aeromonas jandaei]HDX8486344.1 conjugal transfer protein TraH [Aeromonas dhakensis]HDX8512974.1 conjugal transfer protein TraH [Aeromonas dhakensis]